MNKLKQLLNEASEIQISGKNSLCPYLSLALASNFITYDYLMKYPSIQNRLSTKKILFHALGNSRNSKMIYHLIENGYSFKEISSFF